jgi:PKD repeat protein
MSRRAILLFAIALLLAAAAAVQAAPTRPFAPVQEGFTPTAEERPLYAPDRVLVRFRPEALAASSLNLALVKGAATDAPVTGLASLDAALAEVGAVRLVRPFIFPADAAAAKAAAVDAWYQVDLKTGLDAGVVADRLARDPNLSDALPDYYVFPAATPNDTYYPDNWGHNNTAQLPAFGWGTTWDHTGPGVGTVGFDANAEQAWDHPGGFGDSDVIVAIIDSGVDLSHPDLDLVTGWDFGANDSNPDDDSAAPGHGTACAGVAAAVINNTIGAAGAAGGCRIMPLKVAGNDGSMGLAAVTNAIYYAANNGADVVSMSFGAALSVYAPTDAAITYAHNAGVVLLAATGNENTSTISYPSNNIDVIAVGAASPCGDRKRSSSLSTEVNPGVSVDPNGYTCDGERWWGSNYGTAIANGRTAVDVLAPTILPTTDITGAAGFRSGDYEPFFNGTSCATPYAAGVAALIKTNNPSWTPDLIRDRLRSTAQDIVNVESVAGWDRYSGYGMVDAAAAAAPGVGLPPAAAFSVSASTGCAPLQVTFTDETTGAADTWAWDFGDGGTSTEQNPVHTYLQGGSYDVKLVVSGTGGVDSLTVAAAVTPDGPVEASFTASPTSGPAPLTVTFTETTAGGALGYLFYTGDGSFVAGASASYTYTVPGFYTVTMVTVNICGSDSLVVENMIEVTGGTPAPTAAFSATPTAGCVPFDVAFTDESTGDITGRTWLFGDGATSDVADPSHTYATAGGFDVSLIVFGPGGADTLAMPGLVTADTFITADFTPSVTSGPADPLNVTFSDASAGGPAAWSWDFGDAGTDTVQNPTHAFTAEGVYTVTLTASNLCGGDTEIKTDLIIARSPSSAPAPAAKFALAQNYPNPFNPATTIAFSTAKPGHARLEIFDAAGQRIDVLVDGHLEAGDHDVLWQPRTLASGVYFARLEAGGQNAVKRLVLLR